MSQKYCCSPIKFIPKIAKMIQTTRMTRVAFIKGPKEADREFTMTFIDLYLEMNLKGLRHRKI